MDQQIAPEGDEAADSRRGRRREPRPPRLPVLIDPLEPFSTSPESDFAKIDPELRDARELLKQRIEVTVGVSNTTARWISPDRAVTFVKHRQLLLIDLFDHQRQCRDLLRQVQVPQTIDRPTFNRLLSEVRDFDQIIWKEQQTLAQAPNDARITVGILSYPSPAFIGQAYLAALADVQATSVPDDDDIQKLARFCDFIGHAYNPAKGSPQYDPPGIENGREWAWCPVTRAWHDQRSILVVQIMPPSISSAATCFGLPEDEDPKILWGIDNGIVFHSSIAAAYRRNQIVIVPAQEQPTNTITTSAAKSPHEREHEHEPKFKLIVLDPSIIHKPTYLHGPQWHHLHNAHLVFKTKARPHLRNLYYTALMTLCHRHRNFLPGYETDLEKIPMETLWGKPGAMMPLQFIRGVAEQSGEFRRAAWMGY